MSDTTTTVSIRQVDEIDELFCKYPGESSPQPVDLELDTRTGVLSCAYNPNIGGGTTFDHHHRLILDTSIPCLTAEAANALMAELVPLAQRVVDGADQRWDGNNIIGVFTDDAMAAWDEIVARCDDYDQVSDGRDTISQWELYDWFSDGSESIIRDLGITADTTDEQLDAMATEQAEIAQQSSDHGYVILDHDATTAYLAELRDELREAVREALTATAEQLAVLKEQRDDTLRRIKGWGVDTDTLRTLGERASISHTTVDRILQQRRYTIHIQTAGQAPDSWVPVLVLPDYTSTEASPEFAAVRVLANQPMVDPRASSNWRVVVWAGHDADTTTDPLFVLDEAKRQQYLARTLGEV